MMTQSPAPRSTLVRTVLSRDALIRLGLGWLAVAAATLLAPLLAEPIPSTVLALVLAGIVAIIVVAAGGVVAQAEALARRLGDPYGTLVLTLSIVVIEVVLIAAVMLGPGEHATIARDSVMAVSMIILNLALGLCLLVGGLKHGALALNRVGTSSYLMLLVALSALAFALPIAIGRDGAYLPAQALVTGGLTVAVYAFFLWRQMTAQAGEFREVELGLGTRPAGSADGPAASDPAAEERTPLRETREAVSTPSSVSGRWPRPQLPSSSSTA